MADEKSVTGSGYHQNWLTYAGVAIFTVGLLGGAFLFILEFLSDRAAPYLGLNYLVFTALLVGGFVLIPIGMLRERRSRRLEAGHERAGELRIDLTSPAHRATLVAFVSTLGLIVVLSGVGAYQSFQASESVSFCGELCHSVMAPEWTTYSRSAHAKVKCVECHIGPGAGWFVRSKFSGLRQIWATAINSYPRPIPVPIHNLRPARETCEECHWRRKFTGYKENNRSYFLADEDNSRHQLRMLLKIGGEKTSFLKGSGIHYHMLIAANVEYIATDEQRQEIAWVRVMRRDGSVTEYNNVDDPLSEEERRTLEVRTMDCMDCHNRPAHQFPSATRSINQALEDEAISQRLPFIKVQAVQALDEDYASTEEAMTGIASSIRDFYRAEYSELLDGRERELTVAIQQVQEIYRNTVFPQMKAKWSAYPNNISHLESPGCFRCHNDSMEAEDGTTVFTSCHSCHIILAQGERIDEVKVNLREGLPFVHPEDYETIEEYMECVECHTGGGDVYE